MIVSWTKLNGKGLTDIVQYTLHKIVTEISLDNNEFRLWDKDQEVVLLSRTKHGSDIIFVGNKKDTIRSLVSIIQSSNQWINYM